MRAGNPARMSIDFPKIGSLKDVAAFRAHTQSLALDVPIDDSILTAAQDSPLSRRLIVDGFTIGNRWCIHPMEGWDGTTDGQPSHHTLRRWANFGASGAKLIWGGEAFAVQPDGRANPNQLALIDELRAENGVRSLFETLVAAHRARFGNTDDLLVGLQLTHSGRFCKPNSKTRLEPKIAYHHPLLDPRFGIRPDDKSVLITDDYIERLIDNYVRAADLAHRAGFHFVDVKHCHGYLGHEFLSAFTRKGKFGGDFEGRTRFAREIIGRIRAEAPRIMIGVRLSAFDHPPFKPDPNLSTGGKLGPGIPDDYHKHLPYIYAFGCNPNNPLEIDLAEPIKFINMLAGVNVKLINVSACSPYYNPHFQRPAAFPPSDGYQPPEDPLIGVNRQIQATRQLKAACPNSLLVGTGYSYLQEYLPHVAQAVLRDGWADSIGIGRLVLSYWDLLADTLQGRELQSKRLCRTFSDCTTAPRNGIISGCFPLDPHYKDTPDHTELKRAKADLRKRLLPSPK
jgi:2,4-dienoyl-CoA reductase-like NADH-dependent reductase (Old Yellow Enzyme family)